MGPRSLSQDLQIVGLNVNTSCKKQVGESLGTQRTVRVALPCYLLGRARSPSGPALWRSCSTVFHACGPGAFGEIAPPRRFLGEVGFSATQMLSEDFRGRDRSPSGPALWRSCSVAFHACGGPSLRWSVSVAIHARRRGAFGEIAPPRKCSGEAEFVEEP